MKTILPISIKDLIIKNEKNITFEIHPFPFLSLSYILYPHNNQSVY